MSDHPEIQYLNLMKTILENGESRKDRTGIGTLGIFGSQLKFDLRNEFPLFTTKLIHFKSILYELLWFISGSSNISYLQKNGVSIWNEWADENGELGPVYGVQWRKWKTSDGKTIDQLSLLIDALKNNAMSRRHILSAWNAGELDKMALPPCHCFAQWYVNSVGELSCQLYQRSVDVFLGLPFNIASYSLFTMMIAQVCGLKPGDFIFTGGDTHIYSNHTQQVKTQLSRKPKKLATMKINSKIKDIESFTFEDFELKNYEHHEKIVAAIAI